MFQQARGKDDKHSKREIEILVLGSCGLDRLLAVSKYPTPDVSAA
jgi:hypothetical protein